MVLSADTRIEFNLRTPGPPVPPELWADDAEIRVPAMGRSASMALTNVQIRTKAPHWTVGVGYTGLIRSPMSVGPRTGLSRAIAHVFNLETFHGAAVADPSGAIRAARADMRGGGWAVALDGVRTGKDLVAQLRAQGGHAITHVAEFRREDGADFDADQLDEASTVLGYTLALARGAWTFPHLPVGYSPSGDAVWREWSDLKLDRWAPRLAWWDYRRPDSDGALAEAFAALWPLWLDPRRQSVLRIALGFLVEASGGMSPEGRLVLAQAGLELIAWQRLVNEGPATSLPGSAEQQIRDLLATCRIPSALPASLSSAAAAPVLKAPSDGPQFVARVRNRIAHPPNHGQKGPHYILPGDAVVGAWRLALEYLQLSILNWIGYRGWTVSSVDLMSHEVPWK